MTNEQFEQVLSLIRYLGTVGVSGTAAVVSLVKYLNYLEVKERERIVEPAKIKDFIKALGIMEDRVDALEREGGHNKNEVGRLRDDLKALYERLLDNITIRKSKI